MDRIQICILKFNQIKSKLEECYFLMNDYFKKVRKPIGKFACTLIGASVIMGNTVYASPTGYPYQTEGIKSTEKNKSYSEIIESRRALSRGDANISDKYSYASDKDYYDINTVAQVASSSKITVEKESTMHLPDHFLYTEINQSKLREYLNNKNSVLAEEPYFSEIISTSREFNLNPLILFAITGQEQGFVPKHHSNAYSIANNPYNVFYSWQRYNTNIEDTSKIVSRTIIDLSKGCPANMDTFTWINKRYASDQGWSKGVNRFFNELRTIACN